jgi:hypothetical protein
MDLRISNNPTIIKPYELNLVTTEFERIGLIRTYVSLTWTDTYNDIGSFQLVLSDEHSIVDKIRQGMYLYRRDTGRAMVIRSIAYNSVNREITLCGYSTVHLLSQRIFEGTLKIRNIEADLKKAILDNLRGLGNIEVAETTTNHVMESQHSNKILTNIITDVCHPLEIGYEMKFDFDNKKHVFIMYKGLDRTDRQNINQKVIFSEEMRSISNGGISDTQILNDNFAYKNVAYVLGEGEGDNRQREIVGDAVGLERFEVPIDARDLQKEEMTDAQYRTLLIDRGKEKLENDYAHVFNFKTIIDPRDIGIRYNIGDIVTCKSHKYNITLHARITEVSQVVENNKLTTTIYFGQQEFNILKEIVKIWQH